MDESFPLFGSQSSFRQPFSSTALDIHDDTMPNLLDSTLEMTLSQTRIEHEEFVRNENIIDLIENMLDSVETNLPTEKSLPKQEENVLVDQNKDFASPLNVSKATVKPAKVDPNDTDDDDDSYVSTCSKRQMNESIMSIDDPMIMDSKKMKNQLNDSSIMECNDEEKDSENILPVNTNFNLIDLVEQIEDKENLDPKSPNVSDCSLGSNRLSGGNALINFESPQESLQPEQQNELASPIAQIQSPKRPVFTELKTDLFGVIYPDDSKNNTPLKANENNTSGGNLLSISIFETNTPKATETVSTNYSNVNLMEISLLKEEESVKQSPNVSVNKDENSIAFNASIFDVTMTKENTSIIREEIVATELSIVESNQESAQEPDKINQSCNKSFDDSMISTSLLFNSSRQSLKRMSNTNQEQIIQEVSQQIDSLQNNSLNASSSPESSIISTYHLFNNESMNKSSTLDCSQIANTDESMNASKTLNVSSVAETSIRRASVTGSAATKINESLNRSSGLNCSQTVFNDAGDKSLNTSKALNVSAAVESSIRLSLAVNASEDINESLNKSSTLDRSQIEQANESMNTSKTLNVSTVAETSIRRVSVTGNAATIINESLNRSSGLNCSQTVLNDAGDKSLNTSAVNASEDINESLNKSSTLDRSQIEQANESMNTSKTLNVSAVVESSIRLSLAVNASEDINESLNKSSTLDRSQIEQANESMNTSKTLNVSTVAETSIRRPSVTGDAAAIINESLNRSSGLNCSQTVMNVAGDVSLNTSKKLNDSTVAESSFRLSLATSSEDINESLNQSSPTHTEHHVSTAEMSMNTSKIALNISSSVETFIQHESTLTAQTGSVAVEYNESLDYDNFESELKTCIQEMSFVDEEFHEQSTVLIDELMINDVENNSFKEPITDSTDAPALDDVTLSAEEHQSLIETKLLYESKIVDLTERVEQLQAELDESQQHQLATETPEDLTNMEDVTFSMGDRVNLIETKLDYENKIVDLLEQIEQLQEELAKKRETELKENSENANEAEMTFSMEDRINLVETKLAYETEIVNLSEKVEQLQAEMSQKDSATADLNEMKCTYENEISSLKEKIQALEDAKQEVVHAEMQTSTIAIQKEESSFSVEDRINLIENKLACENEITNLKQRIEQLHSEIVLSKQQFESELEAAKNKELVNVELQTSIMQGDTTTSNEITFSMEDRVNLIETKLSYENEIVDLREKVEELQSQIDLAQKQLELEAAEKKEAVSVEMQTSICRDDDEEMEKDFNMNEMTFTMEDRINLIETKLSYENDIMNLNEKLEQLEQQIQANDSIKNDLNKAFISTKEDYEKNIHEHENRIDDMSDEIELLKVRLAKQDTHYVRLVEELEDTIGGLRANLNSYKCKYELTLVPEHQTLKQEHQKLLSLQFDLQSENKSLEKLVLDLDEQRSYLKKNVEAAQSNIAQLSLQISELKLEKQQIADQMAQSTTSSAETINRLQLSCSQYESKIADFENLISGLREDITKLEVELKRYHQEKIRLEEDLTQQKETFEKQLSIIAQQKDDELKSMSTANSEAIARLEMVCGEYETKITELNDLVKSLQSDITVNQSQMNELSEKKCSIEEELSQQRTFYEGQLASLKQQNESSMVQITDRNSQTIAQLEKACSEYETKIAELTQLRSDLDAQLEEMKKNQQEGKAQAETNFAEQKKFLEEQMGLLMKANESMKKDLYDSGDRITELIEELQIVKETNEATDNENLELKEANEVLEVQIVELKQKLEDNKISADLAVKMTQDFEAQKSQMMESHAHEMDSLKQKLANLEIANEKLSTDHVILETKCTNLETENGTLKQHSSESYLKMQEENSILTAQLQSVQLRLESVQIEVASSHSELESRQSEISRLQAQLESTGQDKSEVNIQLEEVKSKLMNIGIEKESLQAQVASLNVELVTIKVQLGDSKEKQTEIDQIRLAKETELNTALREQEKLNERIAKLSGHNDQLRKELNESQNKFDNLNSVHQADKKKHNSTLAELNQQIGQLNESIQMLEQRAALLEQEKSDLKDNLRSQEQSSSDQKAIIEQSFQARIGKLESKKNEFEAELKSVNEEMGQANEKLQRFSNELVTLDSNLLSALQSQNVQLDSSVPSLKKLSKLVEQFSMLKQSLSQVQNQLSHQESIHVQVKKELEIVTQSKDSVIEKLQKMCDDYSDQTMKLENKLLQADKDKANYGKTVEEANDTLKSKITALEMAKTKLESSISDLETKLGVETSAKESIEQTLRHLRTDHSRTLADIDAFQSKINDLEQEKVRLESALSQTKVDLATETKAKWKFESEVKRRSAQIKNTMERMETIQTHCVMLQQLPIRHKLKNSILVCAKLVSDINKLVDKMRTDKSYAESVKTDVVKKILASIREKLNGMVVESKSALGDSSSSQGSSQETTSTTAPTTEQHQVLSSKNPLVSKAEFSQSSGAPIKKLPLGQSSMAPPKVSHDKENAHL